MLSGPYISSRAQAIMPNTQTVNLQSRAAAEGGYAANVSWTATKVPPSAELLEGMPVTEQANHATFQLYRNDQTVMPKPFDRILDSSSVTWEVKHVDEKQMSYVWDCLCLKQLT